MPRNGDTFIAERDEAGNIDDEVLREVLRGLDAPPIVVDGPNSGSMVQRAGEQRCAASRSESGRSANARESADLGQREEIVGHGEPVIVITQDHLATVAGMPRGADARNRSSAPPDR